MSTRESSLAAAEPAKLVPALEVGALSVTYDALVAVDALDFVAGEASITGVVGPNGSGKTSFLNAVTGAVPYQAKSFSVFGNDLKNASPEAMFRTGMSRTFQNLLLVDPLSVAENVAVGTKVDKSAGLLGSLVRSPRSRKERKERAVKVDAALELVGISEYREEIVSRLPYGIRRRVEVARALASEPKIMLLDEPTAGLGPDESLEFASLMRSLVDHLGLSVVVVEHDMAVVRLACDHVYVLFQGALLASGQPIDVLADEQVRSVYLGEFENGAS